MIPSHPSNYVKLLDVIALSSWADTTFAKGSALSEPFPPKRSAYPTFASEINDAQCPVTSDLPIVLHRSILRCAAWGGVALRSRSCSSFCGLTVLTVSLGTVFERRTAMLTADSIRKVHTLAAQHAAQAGER